MKKHMYTKILGMILLSFFLLGQTSCKVKHDNGKHKGWFKKGGHHDNGNHNGNNKGNSGGNNKGNSSGKNKNK